MKNSLKDFFDNYNKLQILNSGVLYMFDTKLTKTEHEKIKNQFLNMVELKNENQQQPQQKIIDENLFEDESLTKLINLKLKSN